MNEETLRKACQEYKDKERRAGYYDVAVEIADAGYPLQASIIILAVWNIARFRVLKNEEYGKMLDDLKNAIGEGKSKFESLRGKDFRTFNFNEIEAPMKEAYSKLSEIKGVKHTGASKVMHLLNRDLFLMWDSAMRKEYGRKFHGHTYKPAADSYIDYHKKMQEKVKNIKWNRSDKTLPKAIDEFNFVNITLA